MPEKFKEGAKNILLIKDFFDGQKKSYKFCKCNKTLEGDRDDTSTATGRLRDNLMENFSLSDI